MWLVYLQPAVYTKSLYPPKEIEGGGAFVAYGPPGLPGDPGMKGEKGSHGDAGLQGPRGKKGLKGEPGKDGSPGMRGTRGVPGQDGLDGSLGLKGDRGDTGPQGPPGEPGMVGGPGGGTGIRGCPASVTLLQICRKLEPPQEIRFLFHNSYNDVVKGGTVETFTDKLLLDLSLMLSIDESRLANFQVSATEGSVLVSFHVLPPTDPLDIVKVPSVEDIVDDISTLIYTNMFDLYTRRGIRMTLDPQSFEIKAVEIEGGSPGSPGAPGVPGMPGLPGDMGLRGEKGSRGDTGLQGIQGKKGLKGEPGKDGSPGMRGTRGVPGPRGRPWKPGKPGASGAQGMKGPKGERGDRGADGVNGLKGETGLPGLPGRNGATCPTGALGPRGKKGDRGEPGYGERGLPGPPGLPVDQLPGGGHVRMVTFRTLDEMLAVSTTLQEGSQAFIADTQKVFIRVRDGWMQVQLGGFQPIPGKTPVLTTLEPAPTTPDDEVVQGQPVLRMIASNHLFTGDMLGVRGADYMCYKQAKLVGLKGTFRAFLTSRVQDLNSLVHRRSDRQIPVVNSKYQRLFNNWEAMFNGNGALYNNKVPIYSFDGRNVLLDPQWPKKIVWHGSDKKGRRLTRKYCKGWSSNRPNFVGMATDLLKKSMLLDQDEYSCDKEFVLLCVENVSDPF